MKVLSAEYAVLLLVVLLAQHSQQLKLNLNSADDVCRLYPDGAEIRKPGTCDRSVTCQDGKSTEGKQCTRAGQGWKLETKTCAKVSDSYCTATKCKKNGDIWVADVKNCQEWVKCNGAISLLTGSCPDGQVFNQTLQMCVYEPSGFKCDTTFDICDVSPQGQKFWDEQNCHKYYTCGRNQNLQSNECPIGTYYVARSAQCIAKAQVDCYKHPIPENVCGTTKLALRNRFVGDEATCTGYFYCKDFGSGKPDTNPFWGQCPKDMFFDATLEACKHFAYVKCDEDRCVGRASGRELSQVSGCQHYLECQNGYTIAEEKCPDDKYFDPLTRECVYTKISYPICA